MIALGLTNKEIAARLKISQRTAGSHVQNMLNKLGASNRAQIVALAPESDPPPSPAAVEAPVRPAASRTPRSWRATPVMAAGALIAILLLSADTQADLVATTPLSATSATNDREISDPFADSDLDTSIWDSGAAPHTAVFQGGGHLAIYIGADAGHQFEAGVNTVCAARGDFDARVSFQLVTWPSQDALWVSLMGAGTPFNTYRTSREPHELYGSYLPPAGREVRASGTRGTLRLTRAGSRWSSYYLAGTRWSWIASGEGPTEDVGLRVIVFNGDIAPFGGKEALVHFRDFQLTAAKIVCP